MVIIMAMIGQNYLIVKTITSNDSHSQPSTLHHLRSQIEAAVDQARGTVLE